MSKRLALHLVLLGVLTASDSHAQEIIDHRSYTPDEVFNQHRDTSRSDSHDLDPQRVFSPLDLPLLEVTEPTSNQSSQELLEDFELGGVIRIYSTSKNRSYPPGLLNPGRDVKWHRHQLAEPKTEFGRLIITR